MKLVFSNRTFRIDWQRLVQVLIVNLQRYCIFQDLAILHLWCAYCMRAILEMEKCLLLFYHLLQEIDQKWRFVSTGSWLTYFSTKTTYNSVPLKFHWCTWLKSLIPIRKREAVVRDMRSFRGHYSLVTDMKVRIIEEFKEQSTSFLIGYFEGHQSTIYWI